MAKTEIEKDLGRISLFIPRFFAGLSAVVAALPLLDRLVGLLPPIIRNANLATVLASITAFAIVGGDFVGRRTERAKPTEPFQAALHRYYLERGRRPSTGALALVLGVLLSVGYIGLFEYLNTIDYQAPWYFEIIAMLWYLAIYSSLAKGFWDMSLRAYATRDVPLDLE